MARNRRSNESAVKLGAVLKVVLFVSLVVGAGAGYVWQKKQIFELTRTLSEAEKKLQKHREYNKTIAEHLNSLSTPSSVENQIRRLGLNLVIPAPQQVVRVVDSTGGALRPSAPGPLSSAIELSSAR